MHPLQYGIAAVLSQYCESSGVEKFVYYAHLTQKLTRVEQTYCHMSPGIPFAEIWRNKNERLTLQ